MVFEMTKRDRSEIKIEKKREMRTKDISKMIAEGGLGAEKYYDIKKGTAAEKNTETPKNDDENK